ncbi:MAG: tetratricopeptide repeat protein [Planctomycetes bacterium]|nr:tetratricopeptide repeat protein [Planctomycetota bacterium]
MTFFFRYMLHRSRIFWVVACIVFIFCSTPSACAEDIDVVREQFKTGQYQKCLDLTRKAIEESTYRSRRHLWALMVESLMAMGQYQEAAKEIDLALLRYPMSSRFLKLGHKAHQFCGQTDRASELLNKIYRYGSSFKLEFWDPPDLVALGETLLLFGSEPRIVLEQLFNRALRNDPNCREAYIAAASLALDKQDYDLAASQYRKALERFGDDPDMHCGLAKAFYHNDRNLMIQSLDAALFINPNHVPSLLLLAEHQIDCEDYSSAGKLLDEAVAVNPWHSETWALRAVISHLGNDPNAVKNCRANALKFWPKNPVVDYLIGRKLSQKYRFAEAAAYQRQALQFDPKYLSAKIQLTEDLLRLGDESKGWTLAEEVYKADQYNVLAYNLVNLRDNMSKFKTLKEDGFIIRMDEFEAAVYGKRVLKLLQEAKSQLCQKYGISLSDSVTLELFPNQQDFAVRTFGMPGGDGFLGVCFGNVITANSPKASRAVNWEATLWHEFCHVVTLNLTDNKMPRWLSEGISVYEERQHNPAWGQHMNSEYRKMILEGELVPISRLSSSFLSPPSPMHLQFAYYESSLVVEFLIEKFGLASLKAILADLAEGEEINTVISRRTASIEKVEKQFEAFAKKRAEDLAQNVDWTKPDKEQVDPSDPEALAQWLTKHPNSFWALTLSANNLLEDENWEQAQIPLKKLISLYPNYTGEGNAYSLLAKIYRKLDETKQERMMLTKLGMISANAVEAYGRLMEIAMEQKDWRAVLDNGNKYLAVFPMLRTVHLQIGRANEELGQNEQAIDSYRRLLLLDPSDPSDVNYRLAKLYQDRDPVTAKRYVLEALADAPRFRQAHRLLLKIISDTSSDSLESESTSKNQDELSAIQEDMP